MMFLLAIFLTAFGPFVHAIERSERFSKAISTQATLLPSKEKDSVHFYSPHPKVKADPRRYATPPIIASAEVWISSMTQKFRYLDSIITNSTFPPLEIRALEAYADFLAGMVSGVNFGESEKSVYADRYILPLNRKERADGYDWAYLGNTMIGAKRLRNLFDLLLKIKSEKIEGGVVETGIWRGGATIYVAGLIQAMELDTKKLVIAADSFRGLPPGSGLHKNDNMWTSFAWYLSVHDDVVLRNFQEYNTLTKNIYFLKGFFNESLPFFRSYLLEHESLVTSLGYEKGIALLRMDGDMYQSTVDILYNLYEFVPVGGYVIVDDWFGFPAKDACEDFFRVHNISPEIVKIDVYAVYWRKSEMVSVQRWRYEQKKFK